MFPLFVAETLIGLSIGGRLFLIAVGLSLIFGVLNVLNFAHGVFYMLGAYGAITVSALLLDNFWLGAAVGIVAVGIVGAIVEFGLIRPLYDRDEAILDQLILTFGVAMIVHELARMLWGSQPRSIPTPGSLDFSVGILGETITAYRLFVIGVSVVVLVGLWLFLTRTHHGHVIRATASDREMAAMLGVDVPRLYTTVFLLGSLLAGLGGALAAPLQAVSPALGDQIIIDAFVVVVIGGLGSISGAFVGAMLVGLFQAFGVQYIAAGDLALPFIAMILVLVFRPRGLLGEDEVL